MNRIILFNVFISFMTLGPVFGQSGTFDFYSGATQDGQSISQTVSGVTLTVYSDHSTTPFPSMALQDWSAYPPFANNAATMNGQAKVSCTFTFNSPVNIASILVADFYGLSNPHLLFTPNTGPTHDETIDGYNGSVVSLNFIHITSFVITNFDGGNIDLGFDNVLMDGSLPVELESFTANAAAGFIELKWQTATEVNNYGFEIQRSSITEAYQNESFDWQKVGFVKGRGNSNSPQNYLFRDSLTESAKLKYRLKQIDNDGNFKYSKSIQLSLIDPTSFVLSQNFPNPFNPSTVISFSLPKEGYVSLKVFDILGSEIKTLINENIKRGYNKIVWDGRDSNNNEVSAGIYIYSINYNGQIFSRKMQLIR